MQRGEPRKKFHTLLDSFRSALMLAVLVFFITGPITGLVLDAYDFALEWQRPVLLSGLAFFLRFLSLRGPRLSFLNDQAQISSRVRMIFDRISSDKKKSNILLVGMIGLAVTIFIAPLFVSNYWLATLILCLIYMMLGMGLNIVVGLAGLLDLGFVGFYALGAYGYALGYEYLGLGFWGALPCAALTAGLFGAVLGFPVLRMHGDYLAIVTLGFGEIIRLILNNWVDFTGGPNGIAAPLPTFFGLEFSRSAKYGGLPFHEFFGFEYSSNHRYLFIYFVLLAAVLLTFAFVERLKHSPTGRAWEALREDEIACRALGINHVGVKLSAFSLGAMIGGIAGVFFAASQQFINPSSFTFFESALILAIVVLGGMGSTIGVIIAALVMTALPELLREFSSYRILIFGLIMVLMMIWRPRGLISDKRKMFELSKIKSQRFGA
ncbi:MAG: high-affinity branched-chain amino acid ABC transporter permease LivM [Oligoflexales bacterium]|nr:high-affinity branched-chain amino acid ABC transporter permease LivM [Oligoflexales bacterium]